MTTLFAINPYCRGGDLDCRDIVRALEAAGPVEICRVGDRETLAEAIARIGSNLARVVVGGGDGSLHRALPHVLDAGVPLGVLPLGTANDFARSLALPTNPLEAVALIARGPTRRIDVGVVNGVPFLNAVGIGLGPELTREMDREKKKRLGVLAYLDSLIQVVGRRRRRSACVMIDGHPMSLRFLQITIANGRHYGGGMMTSDEAAIDDSLLHVLCVRPLTPWQLALRGFRIKFGSVRDDEKLIYRHGQDVRVTTRVRRGVTADGELVTHTPIRCQVMPSALTVYAPNAQDAIEAETEAAPAPLLRRVAHQN